MDIYLAKVVNTHMDTHMDTHNRDEMINSFIIAFNTLKQVLLCTCVLLTLCQLMNTTQKTYTYTKSNQTLCGTRGMRVQPIPHLMEDSH